MRLFTSTHALFDVLLGLDIKWLARQLATCLGLSLILTVITGVLLSFVPFKDAARSGVLYFREQEAIGFFLLTLGILMWVCRRQANRQVQFVMLRLTVTLAIISFLCVLTALVPREFAQIFLICFSCCMLIWTFYGRCLREAVICIAIWMVLLILPFDIVMTDAAQSTAGRHASVDWVKVHYGLIDRRDSDTDTDTYNMGCVVPPNPLKWVLRIDVWPAVDRAFESMDELLQTKNRTNGAV